MKTDISIRNPLWARIKARAVLHGTTPHKLIVEVLDLVFSDFDDMVRDPVLESKPGVHYWLVTKRPGRYLFMTQEMVDLWPFEVTVAQPKKPE